MSALGILLCLSACVQAQDLHFFDLNLQPDTERHVTVTAQVEPLIALSRLDDDLLGLSAEMHASLDGPLVAALGVMGHMDAARITREDAVAQSLARIAESRRAEGLGEMPEGTSAAILTEPALVAAFSFTLSTRRPDGKPVDSRTHTVRLSLSPIRGSVHVTGDTGSFSLPLAQVARPELYRNFLLRLALPDAVRLKIPREGPYLTDLYYRITETGADLEQTWGLTEDRRALRILRTLAKLERDEQLGVTYAYTEDGRPAQCRSGHLHMLHDLFQAYDTVQQGLAAGKPMTGELEAMVARAPAEAPLLAMLAKAYAYSGRRDEAYQLLRRLEPLVAQHPRSASMYREIQALREGERRKLLKRRKQFQEAREATLVVDSPAPDDYVGGPVTVHYRLLGKRAPLIQVDLKVNDVLLDSRTEGPHELHFTPDGSRRHLKMEVTAWFKDKTYARTELAVRYLYIAEQETVQRIKLRTLVTRGKDQFLTDLTGDRFQIYEHARPRDLVAFRKDTAPLRIAVLVDTSGSMAGDKLYQAQYALNAFLKSLGPEDSAAVYTFDHKVLKMTEPTNHFETLSPRLFTMRPQLTTSLHDALLVAHNDLRDADGTKVIIVLSDGNDSTSLTRKERIADLLGRSNVLVYPIILERASGLGRQGAGYLDDLAALTGSIVTELGELHDLEAAFARIYRELKAFYFLEFYSDQAGFDIGEVTVAIQGSRGKARIRRTREAEDLYASPDGFPAGAVSAPAAVE